MTRPRVGTAQVRTVFRTAVIQRVFSVGLAMIVAGSTAGLLGGLGGGAPRPGVGVASAATAPDKSESRPSVAAEAIGGVLPTATPDATKSVVPTSTAIFARMIHTSLHICFPAAADRLIAVGFHQADNRKAVRFMPSMTCHRIDKPSRTRALLKKDPSLKLFQQPLRGRGSSNFSAADCAVKPNTVVLAPVSGVVTNVRHYKLYGRIDDMRVEIKPDGAKHLRVVEIHIRSVKVKKGDRVVGGVTPVAVVRHLPVDSTVNRFLPITRADHVHVQVNLDTFRGSY